VLSCCLCVISLKPKLMMFFQLLQMEALEDSRNNATGKPRAPKR
jgi:hypothetical protein